MSEMLSRPDESARSGAPMAQSEERLGDLLGNLRAQHPRVPDVHRS
jgi:hypothetical protein